MNITIREYTESDHDALLSMIEALADHVVATDPIKRIRRMPEYGNVTLKKLLEETNNNRGKIFFAEIENTIVGFASCFPSDPQTPENLLELIPTQLGNLTNLYVSDDYRAKGVGSVLLEKVESYLKSLGCDSLWVVVFSNNIRAHEYYKKIGFMDREIGMLKHLK